MTSLCPFQGHRHPQSHYPIFFTKLSNAKLQIPRLRLINVSCQDKENDAKEADM